MSLEIIFKFNLTSVDLLKTPHMGIHGTVGSRFQVLESVFDTSSSFISNNYLHLTITAFCAVSGIKHRQVDSWRTSEKGQT